MARNTTLSNTSVPMPTGSPRYSWRYARSSVRFSSSASAMNCPPSHSGGTSRYVERNTGRPSASRRSISALTQQRAERGGLNEYRRTQLSPPRVSDCVTLRTSAMPRNWSASSNHTQPT